MKEYRVNTEQAKAYLRMLGEKLQERKMMGEILLNDGVIVLLDIGKPEEQVDIDAYMAYLKGEGPPIERQTGMEAYFKGNGAIVREVAANITWHESLSPDWLQDALNTLFFTTSLQEKWLEYSGLRVYIAPLEYMLAMKIVVSNDANDGDSALLRKKLHISNVEGILRVVREYMPEQLITPHMYEFIEQIQFT